MKIYIYTFVILIIFSIESVAQSNIAIGEWKSYLPFQRARNMTQSDTKVYFNTGHGLFSIEKSDESVVDFLTKVEGLNGSHISFIEYDSYNEQLFVIYDDSRFDIVKDGNIFPILGIAQSNGIPGDKTINSFYIADERYAYIATGFGMIQFDLQSYDFGYTCNMGQSSYDIVQLDTNLFAATADGIYKYNEAVGSNPADFNQWSLLEEEVNLPTVYSSDILSVFDNHLYAGIDGDVWKRESNGDFVRIIDLEVGVEEIQQIYAGKNELLVGYRAAGHNSKVYYIQKDGNILEGNNTCSNYMTDVLIEPSGRVWFCDLWDGIRFISDKYGECNFRAFSSPFAIGSSDIDIVDNVVYVANDRITDKFGYSKTRYGYSILKDNEWENFVGSHFKALADYKFSEVFRVVKDPVEPKVYLGSYYNGIIIHNLEDGSVKLYNKDNSSLEGTVGDEARTRIAGMKLDESGNLWLSNFGATNAVSVMTPEGKWRSFNIGSETRVTRIVIDEYNNKWFATYGGGVVVLKTNDDVINGSYKHKSITALNSAMIDNVVNDIILDSDGSIWIGTQKGPVIFNCGDVFEGDCNGYRQKVVEDGDVAHLLDTENVRTIAIDGANRKWFGTTNGIFVQSSDGEYKVQYFDENNSPLFDNTILDFGFNPLSGEMFILTDTGIQSYRTKTTGGGSKHESKVYAFPNPVRPDYAGDIAIKGLPYSANVKITDITGKLVYETTALGGQALWDGMDYNGVKAATGVYLVFSASTSSFDTSDSYVTKIFIVN